MLDEQELVIQFIEDRLLIAVIALFTHTPTDQAVLLRHANMIERGSHEGIPEDLDRKDIKERYLSAVKAIGET